MRYSKNEIAKHEKAETLINLDRPLNDDEKVFIIENWQEGFNTASKSIGAVFTPLDLAFCTMMELEGGTVIDLCAGIGALGYAASKNKQVTKIVCVEFNQNYVRVGKRILPEAEWITGDVLSQQFTDKFDFAISNPPFGIIKTSEAKPNKYKGNRFEFKVAEKAKELARNSVFIVPQESAGFYQSGRQYHSQNANASYQRFNNETGISFEASCVDTSVFQNDWRDTIIKTEVVVF